jgi:hypothetical protein
MQEGATHPRSRLRFPSVPKLDPGWLGVSLVAHHLPPPSMYDSFIRIHPRASRRAEKVGTGFHVLRQPLRYLLDGIERLLSERGAPAPRDGPPPVASGVEFSDKPPAQPGRCPAVADQAGAVKRAVAAASSATRSR